MTFQESCTKLDRYLWAIAHRLFNSTARSLPGMSAEDLHQEGLILLWNLFEQYGPLPEDELKKILSRSMQNKFIDLSRKTKTERAQVVTVDLDVVSMMIGETGFQDLFLKHYQEDLAYHVSADAGLLLAQLLDPDPALVYMHRIQNARRAHLLQQGVATHINHKIPKELVGKYLGFSLTKTKHLLKELQQAWRDTCQPRKWQPNAAMS